jgi:hypothetical protein
VNSGVPEGYAVPAPLFVHWLDLCAGSGYNFVCTWPMDYRYTEAVISNKRLKQECQIHEICLLNVYNIMSTLVPHIWLHIQSNLYIKDTQENLENVPFIYRLKLYELFRNGKNETALYRLICYIEVPFKAGLTVYSIYLWQVGQHDTL